MRRFLIVLAGLMALTFGSGARAQVYQAGAQTSATESITVELVATHTAVVAGSTVVVALKQQIAPGWHTYWRNPGDSGGPTTLKWALPPGYVAGEIVWPVPERQPVADLVNYGYSGQVYLPVAVQVPGNASGTAALQVTADLFVCSAEICVPETFRLRLDLPVRDRPGRTTGDAAAIQATLDAAPRPAALEARFQRATDILTVTMTGQPLAGGDPGPVWFFPYEGNRILHAAAQSGERGASGLSLRLAASQRGGDGPLAGVLQTTNGAYEVLATPGPALGGTTGLPLRLAAIPKPNLSAPTAPVAPLWQLLLFALAGGLILNLMPCVFPILAMKAAALVASAHDRKAARADGLLFMAGVLTAFVALAGLLLILRAGGEAVGWGFQLQSPAVTAALALLMLAVGLNLSGVYHIGSGLQGLGQGPLQRLPGGVVAFLTGVLAVVVAAPCTAPFMAAALGAALVLPWPAALSVFLALGLGLGLPYLVVSVVPGLWSRLPRPGPWMERLRGLLAFPMYATALWLAWVVDRQIGAEGLALVLAAGLTLAFALWLFGQGQMAQAEGRRAVLHLTAAAAAAILAVGLTVTAARTSVPEAGGETARTALPSLPWSEAAVATALAEGRPVLVNLTADWCVTCKINERAALSSPRVAEALTRTGTLYLVGDWTRRDDAITAELARRGRSGVPLYLLFTPGQPQPRILPQILTEGTVIAALDSTRPR